MEIHDEVRQTAKKCIEAANQANVDRMHTEMKEISHGPSPPLTLTERTDNDPVWQALTSCQISMPLHKLMQMLPHFKKIVQSRTTGLEPTTFSIHLMTPEPEPPLMDSQNPVVKIAIKGREVHGCIIDGGLGVNVISEVTCHDLGLTQWEPCSFWLRMADMRLV